MAGVVVDAVIFDIGGVLELTPATGWERRWSDELGLTDEDFERRLAPLWQPGELGHASLETIERQTAEELGLDQHQLDRLTDDIWTEYLGTLNTELVAYFAALRPRYRTAIQQQPGRRPRARAGRLRVSGPGRCHRLLPRRTDGQARPAVL